MINLTLFESLKVFIGAVIIWELGKYIAKYEIMPLINKKKLVKKGAKE